MRFSKFLREALHKSSDGQISTGWAIVAHDVIESAGAAVTADDLHDGNVFLFTDEAEFNRYIGKTYNEFVETFDDEGRVDIDKLHSDPAIQVAMKARMLARGYKDPRDMTFAEIKKLEHWNVVEEHTFIFSKF